MGEDFLPYGRQWIDESDVEAVAEALRSDWLTTGPRVSEFEERLCQVGGVSFAVAVSSGTAALHAAYAAAGVSPGDEVIVPALTFSATANAAVYLGATIRFADLDPKTLTVDVDCVKSLMNRRTRVIAAVDYAGQPADYDRLRELADEAGVLLVADACHSLGGAYKNRPVGSLADLTCLSFHPVKTVTTGEGGAVLTDDEELAERARRFRNQGMRQGQLGAENDPEPWAYDIHDLGYNYRITDFQCALGLSQLVKLPAFRARRCEIAARYRELLADIEDILLPPDETWCSHGYHLFPIRVPPARRREIFDGLRARQIGVQVHYIPVNNLAFYRQLGHSPESTPRTLDTYRQLISLPLFPQMEAVDVDRVVRSIRDLV